MAGGWWCQGQVPPRTEDAMPPPPPPPTHHPWHHYARPHTACQPRQPALLTPHLHRQQEAAGLSAGAGDLSCREPGLQSVGELDTKVHEVFTITASTTASTTALTLRIYDDT